MALPSGALQPTTSGSSSKSAQPAAGPRERGPRPVGGVVDDQFCRCAGAGAHRSQPAAPPGQVVVPALGDLPRGAAGDVGHDQPAEPILVATVSNAIARRRPAEAALALPPGRRPVLEGLGHEGAKRAAGPEEGHVQPAGRVREEGQGTGAHRGLGLGGLAVGWPVQQADLAVTVTSAPDEPALVPRHPRLVPFLPDDLRAVRRPRRIGAEVRSSREAHGPAALEVDTSHVGQVEGVRHGQTVR